MNESFNLSLPIRNGDSCSSSDQSKYQMVALDLDGTLLQSNHQVADIQADYLRSLYQKGMTICIATGRAAPSVYEHVQKLNIPASIPVVCSNGARGFKIRSDTMEKEELFYHPVSRSIVETTLEIAQANSFAVQYYHEDCIYVSSNKPEHLLLTSKYTALTGSTIIPVLDNFKSMLDKCQLPSKLLVLFDETKIALATKLYQEEFSSCTKTEREKASIVGGAFDWFLEVLNPIVTKGFGLQTMCKQLQIPIAECIAMGDGANDLEFLEMAGLGLAMKNAREIVKRSADRSLEWTNEIMAS